MAVLQLFNREARSRRNSNRQSRAHVAYKAPITVMCSCR